MLANIILTHDNTIKQFANKGKEKTDDNYITDNNLYFIGGFFAYLTYFFGASFYLQTFFGFVL